MASPLSGSLASAVYAGLKSIFLDATLERDTYTEGSPDVSFDPTTPTATSYTCKAMRDNYSNYEMAGGLIKMGDAKVLILANSLSVTPQQHDRITIQSATFNVVSVLADPANAVWTCQVRK